MYVQLVDDVLDFEQSSETLGKPALNDLKQGIATAPVLFAAQVRRDIYITGGSIADIYVLM